MPSAEILILAPLIRDAEAKQRRRMPSLDAGFYFCVCTWYVCVKDVYYMKGMSRGKRGKIYTGFVEFSAGFVMENCALLRRVCLLFPFE